MRTEEGVVGGGTVGIEVAGAVVAGAVVAGFVRGRCCPATPLVSRRFASAVSGNVPRCAAPVTVVDADDLVGASLWDV